MVNKDCYGPPLACTEGSWRSLLPGLSQWRSHNGKLKAEAIVSSRKGLATNGGVVFLFTDGFSGGIRGQQNNNIIDL